MGKKVAAINPEGEFGFIDEEHVASLERAGGRALTKQETAERAADEAYDQKSLAEKATSLASIAGPVPFAARAAVKLAQGKGEEISPSLPPAVESYAQGVSENFAGGVPTLAMKELTRAAGGDRAANAYVEKIDTAKEANPLAHTAGGVAGIAGSVVAGGPKAGLGNVAKAIPGVGITAAGEALEQVTAKALAGVASKGVLGRAAAAGAGLAVRGAAEGALLGGASSASDSLLHDTPVFGGKLYSAVGHGALAGGVLGGILGTGGSLAASGLGAAKQSVLGALARRGATAAEDARAAVTADRPLLTAAEHAKGTIPTEARVTANAAGEVPAAGAATSAIKNTANELAFDALGATKVQARKALENVEGSARAVGEYVNRAILAPMADGSGLVGGAVKSGLQGRADQLLEAIQADKAGRIATGLSGAIKDTPARMSMFDLAKDVKAIYGDMLTDPTKIAGAEAFKSRVELTLQALQNGGKIAADGTLDAADSFYTRASLERQAYEMARQNSAAGDAFKVFLRKWDGQTVTAIDTAAAKAGKGGAREQILHWKREWQLASAAEEAAQGGAERVLRNNIFGLREGIGMAVGLATGHAIPALAAGIAGKVVRERGASAAAAFLYRAADAGALAGAVRKLDQQVAASAASALREAPKAAPAAKVSPRATARENADARAQTAATQKKATDIIQWMSETRANPRKLVEHLTETSDVVGRGAGSTAADSYTATTLRAIAYVASYIPVRERRDPLDPRSVPPPTYEEADRLVRAATYATHPPTVFADFARGRVTPEGLRAARELQADAFADFQTRLLDHIEAHMARGERLTQTQRLRIDKLLGSAAGADFRPAAIARLQANFMKTPDAESPPAPGPTGHKPVDMKVQQTGFDAVEARHAMS